jgi:hypothetical protein
VPRRKPAAHRGRQGRVHGSKEEGAVDRHPHHACRSRR